MGSKVLRRPFFPVLHSVAGSPGIEPVHVVDDSQPALLKVGPRESVRRNARRPQFQHLV